MPQIAENRNMRRPAARGTLRITPANAVRKDGLAAETGLGDEPGRSNVQETVVPSANPQPLRALELANHVRRTRSNLKTRVANGQLAAAEIIATCPPEVAGMSIAQLLASQRGWGETRSRAFLRQVDVREDKSIGSLTDRQRRAVASSLARAVVRASPMTAETADATFRSNRS